MDRLKKIKKECQENYNDDIAWLLCKIERLGKENNDLILANKGRGALTKAQFKVMERLEKEKEWLVQELSYRTARDRLAVDKEMHQALKEGTSEDVDA